MHCRIAKYKWINVQCIICRNCAWCIVKNCILHANKIMQQCCIQENSVNKRTKNTFFQLVWKFYPFEEYLTDLRPSCSGVKVSIISVVNFSHFRLLRNHHIHSHKTYHKCSSRCLEVLYLFRAIRNLSCPCWSRPKHFLPLQLLHVKSPDFLISRMRLFYIFNGIIVSLCKCMSLGVCWSPCSLFSSPELFPSLAVVLLTLHILKNHWIKLY